mgnify:CR=1 FL=1
MTTLGMLRRRVRVPGVPVDFRVPAGWPTPTDRWIQDNVFWQPVSGWTPRSELQPAPEGWRYWSPNPEWRGATAPAYRFTRVWARVAALLGIPCIVLVVVALFAGIPLVVQVFGWVVGAIAISCLVVYGIVRRRITHRVLMEAALIAAQERRERLIREYQR